MFKAYAANSGNLTHDGKPIPPWEKLTPAVRSHWCAAALEGIERAVDVVARDTPPCPCKEGIASGEVVEATLAIAGTNATATASTPYDGRELRDPVDVVEPDALEPSQR